jgi:hypothetical protein
MHSFFRLCLPALLLIPTLVPTRAAEREKEVTGAANYLRSLPKSFATLQKVDPAGRKVTLLREGDKEPREWELLPDAEVKVAGWWGRLDDLTIGDRVWVWFDTDRKRKPTVIAMLADEPSEQDIHGQGVRVVENTPSALTIRPVKGKKRTLRLDKPVELPAGSRVYVQSQGERARLVLTPREFEARRKEQKQALRKRWVEEGLPGTVTFRHRIAGELEVMLDHEGLRWGRWLTTGDKVTFAGDRKVEGTVKKVEPWRERTRIRLVVNSWAQADLPMGQRVHLKMTPPPKEVDESPFPPIKNVPASRTERIAWFLANVYCPCRVKGNGCTGHFYTLAGCNPNTCGMPNLFRKVVGGLIDKGMTNEQIFRELRKQKGPDILRPHLVP